MTKDLKRNPFLKKLFQGLCVLCAMTMIGCSKESPKEPKAGTTLQPLPDNVQQAVPNDPQVSDEKGQEISGTKESPSEETGPLPDEEVRRLSALWPEMQDLVSAPDAAGHLYSAHQGGDIGTIFGEHYKGVVSIAERGNNGKIKKISVIKEGKSAVIGFVYQPDPILQRTLGATRLIAFRLTDGKEVAGTYYYEKEGVWIQGTENDGKTYSFKDMLKFIDGFAETFGLGKSALLEKAKVLMSEPAKSPVKSRPQKESVKPLKPTPIGRGEGIMI